MMEIGRIPNYFWNLVAACYCPLRSSWLCMLGTLQWWWHHPDGSSGVGPGTTTKTMRTTMKGIFDANRAIDLVTSEVHVATTLSVLPAQQERQEEEDEEGEFRVSRSGGVRTRRQRRCHRLQNTCMIYHSVSQRAALLLRRSSQPKTFGIQWLRHGL